MREPIALLDLNYALDFVYASWLYWYVTLLTVISVPINSGVNIMSRT